VIRGDYTSHLTLHRSIEEHYSADLDRWLGNIYFKISRLSRYVCMNCAFVTQDKFVTPVHFVTHVYLDHWPVNVYFTILRLSRNVCTVCEFVTHVYFVTAAVHVCVCASERERERECVCVCVCVGCNS